MNATAVPIMSIEIGNSKDTGEEEEEEEYILTSTLHQKISLFPSNVVMSRSKNHGFLMLFTLSNNSYLLSDRYFDLHSERLPMYLI